MKIEYEQQKADAISALVESSINLCISKCCKQHDQEGYEDLCPVEVMWGGEKEILPFQKGV